MKNVKSDIAKSLHHEWGWMVDESEIEIATKRIGVVIVWVGGSRVGEYHLFTSQLIAD